MSDAVLPAVPSPTQLRAMLEEMVLGDLLGPAGGPDEELTERNVHDRYLVGVLAPRRQQDLFDRSGPASATPDEDEEQDTQQKHQVSRSARDGRDAKRGKQEARRETDMQTADDEQVVETASPIARDHSPIDLRGAPQKEGGERASNVPVEGGSTRARRGKPVEEPAIDRRDYGKPTCALPLEPHSALDGEAIDRPGNRNISLGDRRTFRREMTDGDDTVAAVRDANDWFLAGDEE